MTLSIQQSQAQKTCIDIADCAVRKTALIIGQSDYLYYDTLANCAHDACEMSDMLQRAGFAVSRCRDLDRRSMTAFIDQWLQGLHSYDLALFYYSGHGVEVDGGDYLVPIDGKFYTDADVRREAYDLSGLLSRLDSARHVVKIVLLDACRGRMDPSAPPPGAICRADRSTGDLLVGYAASPGEIIFARPQDSLSLYTSAIISQLHGHTTLDELLDTVADDVSSLTGRKQKPEKRSMPYMDVCLGGWTAEE